jgi:alpha-galactosidase
VEITLRYLLYPALPVVRKTLTVRNLSSAPLKLENIDVECFNFDFYWPATMSWVYSDYGRRKSLIPFVGGRQDALVALHNPDWGEGVVLGNEAAGVNKYTAAFADGRTFKAGLARKDAGLPFRRWIEPGARFTAPRTFAIVYADTPRFEDVLNTVVTDFVRRHMDIRLSRLPVKPSFVYNTWEPFQKKIDAELVMSLATAAAAAGVKEFVIDDGWQDSYGDWGIDRTKFPDGLKPVIDHIKALGMKPGIWVSIGSADPASSVYRAHPEWFAVNADGRHYAMQGDENEYMTACFSTGWRDYIKGVLLRLTEEYGLEYLKLDFAVVSSPYQYDTRKAGCYANNHPGHRDHAESLSVNFDVMWQVFDEIHAKHPQVFIDCTFEAMGGLQLIDYAMLQHAEGNWLSNYNEPGAQNDLRVRNMAWWRSPTMPATALVIGNSKLNDAGYELHLMSLAGALPIVLGDPRTMPPATLARCRRYADWLAAMAERHDIFSFRQDLPGFGEPQEGGWDGFQRINTDTRSGGIVGVFRHNSVEPVRRVTIAWLDPTARYDVRTFDGKLITTTTGSALGLTGFDWVLTERVAGQLFEIRRATKADPKRTAI